MAKPSPGWIPGNLVRGECGWAQGAVCRQVLYQKAMHALNLLLQTFISENKSMDEICFLLQVHGRFSRVRLGRPQLTGLPWTPTHVPGALTPSIPLPPAQGSAGCFKSQGPWAERGALG